LQQEGLAYTFDDLLVIKDYDSDPNIKQTIELYIDSTNQNVNVVTEGLLMRVVAYHEVVDMSAWDISSVWGMITVEPKESGPRSICSTVVPYDNDISNPLTPLTGLLCDLTFPSPNIARMECYFDPTKIDLQNGVKFTTKIKGCYTGKVIAKLKSDGTIKQKSDGMYKIKC
jgi:hypothetical protein